MESCVRQTTKGDLAFQEDGVKFHLLNPRKIKCQKIQVDGCLPIFGPKCDWFVSADNASILIELKGGDIDKAVVQLQATILWLKKKEALQASDRKCYIVTSNRCPKLNTKLMFLKEKFVKEYGAVLIIRRSGAIEAI